MGHRKPTADMLPSRSSTERNTTADPHTYAIRGIVRRLLELHVDLDPDDIRWWGQLVRHWPPVRDDQELTA